jgi:hypothetical protein
MHWPEIGMCECFIEDSLDTVLAQRAHERVGRGDLPQTIDCRGFVDHAAPDKRAASTDGGTQ